MKFNQKFPLGVSLIACGEGPYSQNGILLYSFSGTSVLTNLLDPDSAVVATTKLVNADGDNEGLIFRCSAKFGKTIRDNYAWNHFDAGNLFFGLRGVFSQDPVFIYSQHANRLKLQGL